MEDCVLLQRYLLRLVSPWLFCLIIPICTSRGNSQIALHRVLGKCLPVRTGFFFAYSPICSIRLIHIQYSISLVNIMVIVNIKVLILTTSPKDNLIKIMGKYGFNKCSLYSKLFRGGSQYAVKVVWGLAWLGHQIGCISSQGIQCWRLVMSPFAASVLRLSFSSYWWYKTFKPNVYLIISHKT